LAEAAMGPAQVANNVATEKRNHLLVVAMAPASNWVDADVIQGEWDGHAEAGFKGEKR
jgi:hypothetical protein